MGRKSSSGESVKSAGSSHSDPSSERNSREFVCGIRLRGGNLFGSEFVCGELAFGILQRGIRLRGEICLPGGNSSSEFVFREKFVFGGLRVFGWNGPPKGIGL